MMTAARPPMAARLERYMRCSHDAVLFEASPDRAALIIRRCGPGTAL